MNLDYQPSVHVKTIKTDNDKTKGCCRSGENIRQNQRIY